MADGFGFLFGGAFAPPGGPGLRSPPTFPWRLSQLTADPSHGCAPGSDSQGPDQRYDPISQRFTDYAGNAVTEWTLGYPAVAEGLGALRDADVLDVGCGGGNL